MTTTPPSWLVEIYQRMKEGSFGEESPLDVVFESEFAPSLSTVKVEAGDPRSILNARTRPLFYNGHLAETMRLAVDAAVELGMPRVSYGVPLTFTRLEQEDYEQICAFAGDLFEKLTEGEADWLALVCFMHWASACYEVSKDNPQPLFFARYMFLAGATARELELALWNKEHAARGRKTIRASREGGKSRRGTLKAELGKRLTAMEELIAKGHSVNRAAQLAHERGCGPSADANRKLWNRHRHK
jgi:hypothetical protein